MKPHELAGQPAPRSLLVNVPELVSHYYTVHPDPDNEDEKVSFGTSGHRGSSLRARFNEDHILATTQALCDYRAQAQITGPLFLGKDTHALSEPAWVTALEVLAGNGVVTFIDDRGGYTPTPVLSFAILGYNRGRSSGLSDGIVITPSHNPPEDGGFKYNPPSGGPADTDITRVIQDRANEILRAGLTQVKRVPFSSAMRAETTRKFDYTSPYVDALETVIDVQAIAASGIKMGADPMGGAGVHFWEPIVERHKLNIELVSNVVDPTFSFMHVDKDGKIRMDCSSPYAMRGLIALKDKFDVAFGNDTDYDRHGIVTKSRGLLNPNHYLAVAIAYLAEHRPGWQNVAFGKTAVSSSMINRVVSSVGRPLMEVPVGFKWFVSGLSDGSLGFGGEESAGASFLRLDGSTWTTDKDGFILDLLAAEIMAKTSHDPGELYTKLEERHGSPVYERLDAPATRQQKSALGKLSPEMVQETQLAGETITQKLTCAPGNGAPLGGLKIETENAWFAARPSGTEDVYKIYTESFLGESHLKELQADAQAIVSAALCRA